MPRETDYDALRDVFAAYGVYRGFPNPVTLGSLPACAIKNEMRLPRTTYRQCLSAEALSRLAFSCSMRQ